MLGTPPAFVLSQDQTLAFDSVLNPEVPFKFKTHSRIDCLFINMTRENHSLAFVFFILYRFQGSSRQPQVALALTAQLVSYLISLLSIPFLNFFEHFCFPFETQPERAHTLSQGDPDAKASFPPDGVSAACASARLRPGDPFRRLCTLSIESGTRIAPRNSACLSSQIGVQ